MRQLLDSDSEPMGRLTFDWLQQEVMVLENPSCLPYAFDQGHLGRKAENVRQFQ